MRAGYSTDAAPRLLSSQQMSKYKDRKGTRSVLLYGEDADADATSRSHMRTLFEGDLLNNFDLMVRQSTTDGTRHSSWWLSILRSTHSTTPSSSSVSRPSTDRSSCRREWVPYSTRDPVRHPVFLLEQFLTTDLPCSHVGAALRGVRRTIRRLRRGLALLLLTDRPSGRHRCWHGKREHDIHTGGRGTRHDGVGKKVCSSTSRA